MYFQLGDTKSVVILKWWIRMGNVSSVQTIQDHLQIRRSVDLMNVPQERLSPSMEHANHAQIMRCEKMIKLVRKRHVILQLDRKWGKTEYVNNVQITSWLQLILSNVYFLNVDQIEKEFLKLHIVKNVLIMKWWL